MEPKKIKGGTLRLIDINGAKTPEELEKNNVLYKLGYFFYFAEPENDVKTFRKVYFGDQLLEITKVKPDANFKMVYPVIKFGYDFIGEANGIPNSQCQKGTEYLLHTHLILSDWKKILMNDKAILTSILSPIEDYISGDIGWFISSIDWG